MASGDGAATPSDMPVVLGLLREIMDSSLPGILESSVARWRDCSGVMVPRTCARWSARMKRAVSCEVKALVEATPISGPALVVMVPEARRVMAEPTTLQMARVLDPLSMSSV